MMKEGLLGQEPESLDLRNSFAICKLLSLTNYLFIQQVSVGHQLCACIALNATGAMVKKITPSQTPHGSYNVEERSFAVKGYIVNISGFAGHAISISITQLCSCSAKVVIDNTETNGRGCVPITPFTYKNRQ